MSKYRKGQESPTTLELPEEEQWRLINETGILNRLPYGDNMNEDTSLPDEIFNSLLLIIPFSFLLLMMEILIHHQYGKQPTFLALVDRMAPSVPILSIFIFYTTRYKQHQRMQLFLFLLSIVVGPRMIYLINRGSWLVNMKQCPPLATIWVYTIVQLNLHAAILNLIVVGAWYKINAIAEDLDTIDETNLFAKCEGNLSLLDNTPNSGCVLGPEWHLVRAEN